MSNSANAHNARIEKYYRFHSRIYDATRWSFLFGRNKILEMIPGLADEPCVMEVGCGTGKNIARMKQQFADAKILGVDLSSAMLKVANKKLTETDNIKLQNSQYGEAYSGSSSRYDLVLLSYSLTMMGDDYEAILEKVIRDLKPAGYIAVVDFHTSPFRWFRRWMAVNHVDFEGNLLPSLEKYFQRVQLKVKPAYLGLWSYFLFVGQPKTTG